MSNARSHSQCTIELDIWPGKAGHIKPSLLPTHLMAALSHNQEILLAVGMPASGRQ